MMDNKLKCLKIRCLCAVKKTDQNSRGESTTDSYEVLNLFNTSVYLMGDLQLLKGRLCRYIYIRNEEASNGCGTERVKEFNPGKLRLKNS